MVLRLAPIKARLGINSFVNNYANKYIYSQIQKNCKQILQTKPLLHSIYSPRIEKLYISDNYCTPRCEVPKAPHITVDEGA